MANLSLHYTGMISCIIMKRVIKYGEKIFPGGLTRFQKINDEDIRGSHFGGLLFSRPVSR